VSEWIYIGLAYGLTWTVLLGYWFYVEARTARAELLSQEADA
jgi:hypothetical protein